MSATIRVTSAEEDPLESPNADQATGEALAAFRADVRRFIEQFAPPIPPRAGIRSAESASELAQLKEWTGRLYEAGTQTPTGRSNTADVAIVPPNTQSSSARNWLVLE